MTDSYYQKNVQAVEDLRHIAPIPPDSPSREAQEQILDEFRNLWERWILLHKDEINHLTQSVDRIRSPNQKPEDSSFPDPVSQREQWQEARIEFSKWMLAVRTSRDVAKGLAARILNPLEMLKNRNSTTDLLSKDSIISDAEATAKRSIDFLDRPELERLMAAGKPAKVTTDPIDGLADQIRMTTSFLTAFDITEPDAIARELCNPQKTLVNAACKKANGPVPGTVQTHNLRVAVRQDKPVESTS